MEVNTFDIVNIIEKNAITRLNKDYHSRLITKIKSTFTESEQHIFVGSFYAYLNYDSKKDFVIDFDTVWKWTGFSRKDNAKTVLLKHFVEEVDYEVINNFPEVAGVEENQVENFAPATSGAKKSPERRGGSNKEKILLSVNTFKKFCLKANTKKADEIHDYYIKLEEILQETMDEESSELRNQLLLKNKQNSKLEKEKNKIEKEKEAYEKELHRIVYSRKSKYFKKGHAIYTGRNGIEKDVLKIGITLNLGSRQSSLGNGSTKDFNMTRYWYTKYHKVIEDAVKINFANARVTNKKEFYHDEVEEEINEYITKCVEFFNENNNEKHSILKIPKIEIKDDDEDEDEEFEDEDVYDEEYSEDDIVIEDEEETKQNLRIKNPLLLPEKPCNICSEVKSLENYFDAEEHKDGKENTCKDCVKIRQKKHVEEKRKTVEIPKEKECTQCNIVMTLDKFYKDSQKFDGVGTKCKECVKAVQSRPDKVKITVSEYTCKTCNLTKPIDDFHVLSRSKTGHKYSCKECECAYATQMHYKKIHTQEVPVNNSSTKEEKIAEIKVLKEKKICGCGSVITDLTYARHCTTKKHQKYLEKNKA